MSVFRIQPGLPPEHRKTYRASAPVQTHTRAATCAEVDCAAHQHGWVTLVDVGTELGQRQAGYIRQHSDRQFTEVTSIDSTAIEFHFPAGQVCFAAHRVTLDRPWLYVVRDGDWRGNPRGTPDRVHASGENWAEDFAEHQARLARAAD